MRQNGSLKVVSKHQTKMCVETKVKIDKTTTMMPEISRFLTECLQRLKLNKMHVDFEMFVVHVYYGITHIDLYTSFL